MNLELRIEDYYYVILLLVVIIGFYLRIKNLQIAPFWVDEVYHAWAAKNFLDGLGFSDSIGPSSPYLRSWLTTSLPIAISFKFFGINEFAARFPTVIFGTLSIIVAYFLGKETINKHSGLLLALFIALDPFIISWSREARMYTHLLFFYMLFILIFLKWHQSDRLNLKSKWLVLLIIIGYLGYSTHIAFLGVGPTILLFCIISFAGNYLKFKFPKKHIMLNLNKSIMQREFIIILIFTIVAILYLSFKGIGGGMIDNPPETWPQRDVYYYWDFLQNTYSHIYLLFFPGVVYLISKGRKGWLVIFSFLIPFAYHSIVELKADRYILYVIPFFALISFSFISLFTTLLEKKIDNILKKNQKIGFGLKKHISKIPALIIIVLLITTFIPPSQSLSVSDNQFDLITHKRSDHPNSSIWIQMHLQPDDAIVSMRPELTMWYLGKADYFFRQYGNHEAKKENGTLVHPRTGTTVIDSVEKIKWMFENNERGWIIASMRFYSSFTDEKARKYVQDNTIKFKNDSWTNVEIYYWGPDSYCNSFSYDNWGQKFIHTEGNVRVIKLKGHEYQLALGRTKDTDEEESVFGENTGEKNGSIIIGKIETNKEQDMIIETETFGEKNGRYVSISISEDQMNWIPIVENSDKEWHFDRIKIFNSKNYDALYIMIEGGSESNDSLGGLVKYIRIYPEFQ